MFERNEDGRWPPGPNLAPTSYTYECEACGATETVESDAIDYLRETEPELLGQPATFQCARCPGGIMYPQMYSHARRTLNSPLALALALCGWILFIGGLALIPRLFWNLAPSAHRTLIDNAYIVAAIVMPIMTIVLGLRTWRDNRSAAAFFLAALQLVIFAFCPSFAGMAIQARDYPCKLHIISPVVNHPTQVH